MSITINMTKAKEIHRKHVREARTPLLASLDTDFLTALDTSSDTAKANLKTLLIASKVSDPQPA